MKSTNIEQDTEIFVLDSNILLYAFDTSQGKKHEICAELLDAGFRGDITYFIPTQVLSEFYSVISRGKVSMKKKDAEQIIRYIIELPNFLVKSSDQFTVIEAIGLNKKYGTHYWEASILSVMKNHFISNIYTENTKDFNLPWINAVNPFSD